MTNGQESRILELLASIDAKLGRIADACERTDERMRTASEELSPQPRERRNGKGGRK